MIYLAINTKKWGAAFPNIELAQKWTEGGDETGRGLGPIVEVKYCTTIKEAELIGFELIRKSALRKLTDIEREVLGL